MTIWKVFVEQPLALPGSAKYQYGTILLVLTKVLEEKNHVLQYARLQVIFFSPYFAQYLPIFTFRNFDIQPQIHAKFQVKFCRTSSDSCSKSPSFNLSQRIRSNNPYIALGHATALSQTIAQGQVLTLNPVTVLGPVTGKYTTKALRPATALCQATGLSKASCSRCSRIFKSRHIFRSRHSLWKLSFHSSLPSQRRHLLY